jgi:hypothetical protein
VGVEEEDRGVRDGHGKYGFGGGFEIYGGLPREHRVFVRGLIRTDGLQYPDWYWHSFPPPPYPGHAGETRNRHSNDIAAYTVVSDSHIWASTRGNGTYSLHTEKGEWSKVSDSPLPFRGPAVYAPEHGLWFGLPDDGRYFYNRLLGAWDLHAGADGPVEASGVWEVFSRSYSYPSNTYNLRTQLVHLGDGGRFCVAKLYEMEKPPPASRCARCYDDLDPPCMGFAVLKLRRWGAPHDQAPVVHWL